MIASIAGLSILSIIAVVIGSTMRADLTQGAWPVAAVLPGIGLPLALVLIVVFAVLAIVRRRRIASGNGAD